MRFKKIASAFITAAMLTSSFMLSPVAAETVNTPDIAVVELSRENYVYGAFEYQINDDDTITLTKFIGDGTFNVPSEIDGRTVTTIGAECFKNSSVMTISLPDTITKIKHHAFYNCKSLEKVDLPKNLEYIGGYAFGGCESLTYIKIPKSLDTVDEYGYDGPFHACSALSSIDFEEGITVIPQYLFEGVTGLQKITVPDTVDTICSSAFENCSELKEAVLPDSLKEIYHHAFIRCDKLEKVTLPKNLEYIGGYAFGFCDSLSHINIPRSLTSVDDYGYDGPFHSCSALNSIDFEDGITVIPTYLFENVTGLQEITIPNTVTEIGSNAFENCYYLKTVNFPDTLKTIKSYAFSYCVRLRNIKLPSNLEYLGGGCFNYCVSISNIEIPLSLNVTDDYSTDGPFSNCWRLIPTFDNGRTTITANMFLHCSGLTEYEIPEKITSIGNKAFASCENLTKLTIPKTVTEIENNITINSPYCVIYCYTDSAAHKYAAENKLPYSLLDGDVNVIENLDQLKEYIFVPDYIFTESDTGVILTAYNSKEEVISLPDKDESGNPVVGIDGAFLDREYVLEVTVPDSVISIKNNAFASIASLEVIMIGNNVSEIDDNVFEYTPFVTIRCYKDSFAHYFAYNHGIKFELIDNDDPLAPPTIIDDGVLGDIDGDGKVTARDSLMVQRYTINLTQFSDKQQKNADVDLNGKINTKDALYILQASINLRKLPVEN